MDKLATTGLFHVDHNRIIFTFRGYIFGMCGQGKAASRHDPASRGPRGPSSGNVIAALSEREHQRDKGEVHNGTTEIMSVRYRDENGCFIQGSVENPFISRL